MKYPNSLEEVNAADHYQICKWYRFLPSPETPINFQVMDRIVERFNNFGGFTPEISKSIGWEDK
jgi:hypothetical protein